MIQVPIAVLVDGIAIEQDCGTIRWREEAFGGFEELRMMDGTAYVQEHWRRFRFSVSGSGELEPALLQVDGSQPVDLWGIKLRAMVGTALQYQLPPAAKRRPDVEPWALAQVGSRWVDVDVAMTDDLATLSPIAGAARYRVCWLPRFSVVMPGGVVAELDESTGRYDWAFEARER